MVKKILLIALCILGSTSLAAMNYKPIPSAPNLIEQLHYNQWREVKSTPEFAYCVKLLRQKRGTTLKYKIAFENLCNTDAYKNYTEFNNPSKANVNS